MSSPIFMSLRLLKNPEISNKVILSFAFGQVKAIGFVKILAALLGALIVSVSSFVKIPQIRKLLKPVKAAQRADLAQGISMESVRLETLAQFVHVTYNRQQKNSFVNYGESLFLGVQNVVLLLLLEYYQLRRSIAGYSVNPDDEQQAQALQKLVKPAISLLVAVGFITKIAPAKLISALQMAIIPIGIASKIPQIKRNAAMRSTAHLSQITIGANVVGSLIRVFTTLSSFKRSRSRDFVLLAGYSSSLALNAVLAGQIFKYRDENIE